MVDCSAGMSFVVTGGFESSMGCIYRSKVYRGEDEDKNFLKTEWIIAGLQV